MMSPLLRVASRPRIRSFQKAIRLASSAQAGATSTHLKSLRPLATLSVATALALGAYTLGTVYPPPALSLLFPRPAPGPPADPTSPESIAYTESLEAKLQILPLLQQSRDSLDTDQWYEARPYQGFPEERRVNNLTAGALKGPGKLALPPLIRVRKDESESMAFVHLGRGLCGHDGIVHGGLLATLLDESLARTAIINLPEKVGVTAKLSLSYRAPTRADQFVVIRTFLVEVNGRKALVRGRVEDLQGTVLVEADAMFVQPRYAKLLNNEGLKQAMGEPPSTHVHLVDGQKMKAPK